jgi:hypothetical protein
LLYILSQRREGEDVMKSKDIPEVNDGKGILEDLEANAVDVNEEGHLEDGDGDGENMLLLPSPR